MRALSRRKSAADVKEKKNQLQETENKEKKKETMRRKWNRVKLVEKKKIKQTKQRKTTILHYLGNDKWI